MRLNKAKVKKKKMKLNQRVSNLDKRIKMLRNVSGRRDEQNVNL